VSIPIQIKLLKVLQERVFSPVGSHLKLKFQGRIIAATNRPLDELRLAGQFRDDFYYRLCSDSITIPTLKERINDNNFELDELIKHLLINKFKIDDNSYYKTLKNIIKQNLALDYDWPGNVRELEQAIRRIILSGTYSGDKKLELLKKQDDNFITKIKNGNITAAALIGNYCLLLYEQHKNYEKVSEITGLDSRTVKKYINCSCMDICKI